jgi:serine/threonine-protein kinase SRPK3
MSTASTDSYSDVGNDKYYIEGGYCRINIGDLFNQRYRTVYLLGWGKYGMVWLVWDYTSNTFRAMKATKGSKDANDDANDEIEINQHVGEHPHICKLLDSFLSNGHQFLVFECLGVGLDFISHHHQRLSIHVVESIVSNILDAIRHLKKNGVIHTDIKEANILVSKIPYHVQKIMAAYRPPPIDAVISIPFVKNEITYVPYTEDELTNVKLADLGNSYYDDDSDNTFNVQSDGMVSPEVILGYKYDQAVDIWSVGCIAYALLTGDDLFDCAGKSIDSKVSYISSDTMTYMENRLASIEELLGPIPKYMIKNGIRSSRYIDPSTGKYKHIDNLIPQPLRDRLIDLDIWDSEEEIDRVCNLLIPLLALDPKKRLECIA